MAQADHGPCWDSLPSVIMLEIFSYLDHKDRINSSGVCRNWRQALFHPSFWKDITFALEDPSTILWSSHLADCFALSVQNVTVRCQTPYYSPELERLLRQFRENRNLKQLFIEPTLSTVEWSSIDGNDLETETWTEPIYCSIIKIIETSRELKALTLGCIEELVITSGNVVELLSQHHGKHLTHLGLASVKEDPENYALAMLKPMVFQRFEKLTTLTLDYDYLNDDMLQSLTSGTLERLVVHVHKWSKDHPGTTDAAWRDFTHKNKRCELRLSLLHAYTGITVVHESILRPAMPLSHFKALFCEYVNLGALYRLYRWYNQTLKSLVWMDSTDRRKCRPPTDEYTTRDGQDALVLLAWKCRNLSELIYIGHTYYQENMLAIARLRGHNLQTFQFAESNLISEGDSTYDFDEIRREIKKLLGNNWKTFSDAELMPVLVDALAGDSRDLIMPLVLKDAK